MLHEQTEQKIRKTQKTKKITDKKKDPRSGIKNTQARGRDKIRMTLEWIAHFHFSVCSVLTQLLQVDKTNAHRMLKKLKEKQYIRGIEVPIVREEVYILTPFGLTLSAEYFDHPLNYHTQPNRLNINRLRHDLNVQVAVLNRLKENDKNMGGIKKKITFLAERELNADEATGKYRINNFSLYGLYSDQKNRKIPDALISEEIMTTIDQNTDNTNDVENQSKKIKEIEESRKIRKIALEVELTAKPDIQIYKSFTQHLQAIQDGLYDEVVYIFRKEMMKQYYEKRFLKEIWPRYHKEDEHKKWHRSEKSLWVDHTSIRPLFSFVVEELFNG